MRSVDDGAKLRAKKKKSVAKAKPATSVIADRGSLLAAFSALGMFTAERRAAKERELVRFVTLLDAHEQRVRDGGELH